MDPSRATELRKQAVKYMETTARETAQRKEQGFGSIEELLPRLAGKHDHSFLDAVAAYLGKYNPIVKTVDSAADLVWIFDNAAYLSPSSAKGWEAKFVTAYFAKCTGKDAASAAADVAKAMGLAEGDKAIATIEKRLMNFLNVILPSRKVEVEIVAEGEGQAMQKETFGSSGPDGISVNTIQLQGPHEYGDVVVVKVPPPVSAIPARTTFIPPAGWGVISDIDDTIKRTLTTDPVGILKTTFVDEPEAIPGMPELYKHIQGKLDNPPFWYLSASPYNLYPLLRYFREKAGYPPGTMILRESSWMNLAGFLGSLTKGTEDYKVDRMKSEIHEYWPKRKFICLGDSTQSDPEAYAELYREHPDWIKGIFIRRVVDVTEITDIAPGDQSKQRNEPKRFEKAFEGVPADVWHVFEDASQVKPLIDKLVS